MKRDGGCRLFLLYLICPLPRMTYLYVVSSSSPMGLDELTTYKYVIRGDGQIR